MLRVDPAQMTIAFAARIAWRPGSFHQLRSDGISQLTALMLQQLRPAEFAGVDRLCGIRSESFPRGEIKLHFLNFLLFGPVRPSSGIALLEKKFQFGPNRLLTSYRRDFVGAEKLFFDFGQFQSPADFPDIRERE